MTILVTGGAGFIGTNFILDWFMHSDEPVVTLDALTYAGCRENLASLEGRQQHTFVHGSIADRGLVSRLLADHRPRAIVNFAAETHVDRSIDAPEAFVETNVTGTFQLLEAARRHVDLVGAGEKVQSSNFRFLHVSSDEVYGSLEPGAAAFTELHPYQPSSPYSASKAASDHFVRVYHRTYDLPVLITNCSNNYGPYQYPEKLIPLMICNAVQGKDLPVYGTGDNVRDWLYVGDHCAALRRVLEAGVPGETYNVGGTTELANIDVVHAICELLDELSPRPDGTSYRNQVTLVADRAGHDKRYAIDTSKIANDLGWQPQERFSTGLKKTVAWYLESSGLLSA